MSQPSTTQPATALPSRRAVRQQARRQAQMRTYGLITLGAVLLFAAVVAFSFLRPPSDARPATRTLGEATALVLIEEFADFQCPYCRVFSTTTEKQINESFVKTGKARFVFNHFAFIGTESIHAAEASECAGQQGKFWEYHDTLFNNQAGENVGTFSDTRLKQFGVGLNLDMNAFNTCYDSHSQRGVVDASNGLARTAGVNSTPTLFIGSAGRRIQVKDPLDFAAISQLIESEWQRAGGK